MSNVRLPYNKLDLRNYALCPHTGTYYIIDDPFIQLLHNYHFVATRISKTGSWVHSFDSRYGADVENLVVCNFPFHLENLWNYDKIYYIVDYMGCPILVTCTLDQSRYLIDYNYEKEQID